jgi:5-methylcytosine-specific restriction endonuclease McrBC regulatory subunit McrC
MNMPHEIGELDQKGIVLSLTQPEQRVLRRVADRLGAQWQPDGTVRIYSKGNVGSVALSPRTVISVTTKVPVANLLGLASLAYRTLRIPPAVGETLLDSVEPVLDWLAVLLITEIENLVAFGMRQGYVVVEDELPYVRGRLRFDSRSAWTRPGLVSCEFADFLPDTPENQVLRFTLDALASRRLLRGLRVRAEGLLRSFDRVALVQPSLRQLDACQGRVMRLNQHYAPAFKLCRLLLEGSGVEAENGAVPAPAYFFPLPGVFQEAVANLLKARLPNVSSQTSSRHQPIAGSPPLSMSYKPDVVLGAPPQLVVDTKYAKPLEQDRRWLDNGPVGRWAYKNEHIYQVAFYGLSLSCPALLVYPRDEQDVDATFDIKGVRVSLVTVDLREPGLVSLERLVERVSALAGLPVAA